MTWKDFILLGFVALSGGLATALVVTWYRHRRDDRILETDVQAKVSGWMRAELERQASQSDDEVWDEFMKGYGGGEEKPND